MEMPIIEFKRVTKKYKLYKSDKRRLLSLFSKKVKGRYKVAVFKVSFKIMKGESVALIGRNGAGKSTILKMMTGVSYPTDGEIIVNGRVSALLELTSGFDSEFTGRENIFLKGQLMGLKTKEIKKMEDSIIEFAELSEYIDQPVRTYSSGMKARLGFAISTTIEPDILIVDEALSVGDAAFKTKCKNRINDIMTKDGMTLLFVTHSGAMAKEFCKRGIVINNGKKVHDSDIDSAITVYEKILGLENNENGKKA
jgi:teichoic acid transport system ATP-binding protein